MNEGRFQTGKRGHAKRVSLEEVEGSGHKSSPGQSAESWFHS